ncbi:glutamate--tRNA ligase [Pseudoflavonifractor sp. 524-17]|uniref:glutamate--tRNA ligase n=1 Tax=Pseudoflavonifractor sp. 524-17 TaxID=2304577 RepID=UPI00192A592F|nr:glutamate--tRNA ligase [Pseudoflavonifractor sp. 524-17]
MKWFDEMEARIPKGEVRTRFAPSPTGYMHVGNLRTALYTWLIARHSGGKFLLRIEDTDQGRLVEDAVDVIYKTLRRCGLDWDEGPDVGGPVGPYIQTERRDFYGKYAQLLIEKGYAYRCFCDKERLESLHGADGLGGYDGRCRNLSQAEIDEKLAQGVPCVIRQKIPAEGSTTFVDGVFGEITVENSTLDDQVLIKSDGLPTYNFANVIDDHLMGITHVVRGSEYLSSTPKYNLLYQAFGWELPAYLHCSPVMRDAHNKMSKRKGDPSYEDLLAMGFLSEAVVNYVTLLGWSPRGAYSEREFFTLPDLAEIFETGGISKSPAIFDLEKLKYFNASYLRALPAEEFYQGALPYLKEAVKNPEIDLSLVAPLVQPRCETWLDIAPQVDFLDALPSYGNELYCHKKMKTNEGNSLEALELVLPVLEGMDRWEYGALHDGLLDLAAKHGLKNGRILWPVRTALSGKAVTPGGAVELCHILGKEEALRRIQAGIEQLRQAKQG